MSTTTHDVSGAWIGDGVAEQYKLAENATRPYGDFIAQKIPKSSLEGEIYAMDLACGTGAMVAALYDVLPAAKKDSARVIGADISSDMLKYLETRGQEEGWKGLETKVVDARDMEFTDNTYTHFFINFGVMLMPNGTLKKCHDSIKPGGFIAVTGWQKLPWYPMFVRAAESLPSPPPFIPTELNIMSMFCANRPWQDPEYTRKELEDAGFEKVNVVLEERDADTGTAEQLAFAMGKVFEMIGMLWPEDGRAELVEGVKKGFLAAAKEDIGDRGSMTMKFEGIVGTGFKKV